MRPKHAEYQAFLRPEIMSAQRESNRAPSEGWSFRHGKATGCRYIMGAWLETELPKIQEHRVGLEPTSPRYEGGVFAARRPVRVVSGTGGYRTHIVRFKRPVHCPVCHSPEYSPRGGS